MNERSIIIGMILSTEFLQRIRKDWDIKFLKSDMASRLALWVMEYFDEYNRAPGRDIEPIFYKKSKNLDKDVAEDIEDILADLSDESGDVPINVDFLVKETKKLITEEKIRSHIEKVEMLLDRGEIDKAEKLVQDFVPPMDDQEEIVDFSDPRILEQVRHAFKVVSEILIKFPGALGEFWNEHMVRGGFVALLGTEKRGKTFWLLEFAMKALQQGRNVAFFQAGDMNTPQQIMRVSINLTRKSNKEKYCGLQYEPVRDCVWNQNDECTKPERICRFGVFPGKSDEEIRTQIRFDELRDALLDNPDYTPCTECKEYLTKRWGCAWLKEVDVGEALTEDEAVEAFDEFFIKNKRRMKMATYATGTLTVKYMNAMLDLWAKRDGFIPDVIIVDYPDIMTDHGKYKDNRELQNKIWMGLRAMSQQRNALVVTVTQADAKAYTKEILDAQNFSEDKRKYAHVTAFFGLNQDKYGREKEIGIMRINDIVVREGEFHSNHQVHVLQNLRRGRSYISSYF